MVLGGFANNKGAVTGAFVLTIINQVTLVSSTLLQSYVAWFNPNLVNYSKYLLESLLLLLLLIYRPRGLLKESRIDTPAYKVLDKEEKASG
jgi:branched-chain amino acid transport system permease protein